MIEAIVVGAGLAGAATACFLASPEMRVTVLEAEDLPGVHSSGRNAAMIRQVVHDSKIASFAREGARFLRENPRLAPFATNGSLLLARGSDWDRLRCDGAAAVENGVDSRPITSSEAVALVPLLEGARFDGALLTPSDGVVDVASLLQSYLCGARERGGEVLFGRRFLGVTRVDGHVAAVSTDGGSLPADVLINAAGPWAGEVAKAIGALEEELTPMRRHLYVTQIDEAVDTNWPWVWNLSDRYYFRPESGGLLLSCCDEDPAEPGLPTTVPEVRERLSLRFQTCLPGLKNAAIRKEWAGLRTFTRDRAFLLGSDKKLRGYYWAAALGGHGVTCSAAIGRHVAGEVYRDLGMLIPRLDGIL